MGTRHLICIWWKGQWVVAQYGQWDGMPDGQGIDIYKFLVVPGNIDKLKVGLEKYTYKATKDDLASIDAECEAWEQNYRQKIEANPEHRFIGGVDGGITMTGLGQLYPSLSRDAGAKILTIIARAGASGDDEEEAILQIEKKKKKVPVGFNLTFANDGLFCEWAYVIDLDKEVLEIYGGCEHKHDEHRFKDVGPEGASVPGAFCTFTFLEILEMKTAQDFMDSVNKATGQDEEEEEVEED